MMTELLQLFTNYTFLVVAAGSALLGLLSGMVGTFVVLRRQSLLGDAVSHSALPGIALAFLLTGIKETEILLVGALLSGLAATYFIGKIVKHSKITYDTALALVMSVFFGVGMILLSIMQQRPGANQAGIKNFIFGDAASLLEKDVLLLLILTVLAFTFISTFWKELKIFTFDPQFAKSIGYESRGLSLTLSLLTVLTVIAGLQTVGVILMSAMLIAPAVAARQWSDSLKKVTLLSAVLGAFSGVAGTVISTTTEKMPTGPSIVIIVSAIALVSILFAPGRGVIWKYMRTRKNKSILSARKNLQNEGKPTYERQDASLYGENSGKYTGLCGENADKDVNLCEKNASEDVSYGENAGKDINLYEKNAGKDTGLCGEKAGKDVLKNFAGGEDNGL